METFVICFCLVVCILWDRTWVWPKMSSLNMRVMGLSLIFSSVIPEEHDNPANTTQICLCKYSTNMFLICR